MNKLIMNKVKSILILLIFSFIAIPLITIYLKTREGMTYDMTDKNVKMDLIEHTYDGNNLYGYCLTGDVKCASGTSPTVTGTYQDRSGVTHNIYDLICNDCDEKDKNSDGYCTPGTNELVICAMGDNAPLKNIDYGVSEKVLVRDPPSGLIVTVGYQDKGARTPFEHPNTHLPFDISNGYVYLYDKDNETVDASFSACYFYESKEDCDKKKEQASQQQESEASPPKKDNHEQSFKCVADNGSKKGDPLCCAQDGVLQNTKYNCPSEYPHCVGYKCGETWGKCSKTSRS